MGATTAIKAARQPGSAEQAQAPSQVDDLASSACVRVCVSALAELASKGATLFKCLRVFSDQHHFKSAQSKCSQFPSRIPELNSKSARV